MDKELLDKLSKTKNMTNRNKLELLVQLSELPKEESILKALYDFIEKERYDKIRIKAILILRNYEDEQVIEKLREFYQEETDISVRLALVETLSQYSSDTIEDFLKIVLATDKVGTIRATAIRKIHEREKLDEKEFREIILNTIQNDKDNFPRQIALSIIPFYADKEIYNALRRIFNGEKILKMKRLLFKTIGNIAEKLDIELDIYEPVEDPLEDDKKKKRRSIVRRKKKKKTDEEHLYF